MTNTLKAFSAPAAILSALTIAACSQPASDNAPATEAEAPDAQDAFFANLTELCGQRFEGEVITDRIPFWVGEDHSRTWVITRNDEGGLTLKHDHRDPDGTEHTLHWYGGDTVEEGTANRQEFPVDRFSIDLFNANDAAVSTTNVWAVEVNPGETYVYELARENRLLRVAFDLTEPLDQ